MKVQETTDYSRFSTIEGNRPKNQLHIKRLKASMKEELLVSPIIVNEKMQVIDGQHRLQASKELNLPVRYIVCYGYGLNQVHRLNQNSKNWQLLEFVEGYADMGMKPYIILRDFVATYGFGIGSCMDLICSHSGAATVDLKNGNLVIKNYKKGCLLADYIVEIGEQFEHYKEQAFIKAVVRVSKKQGFDMETFLRKVQLKPLKKATHIDAYVGQIEDIYNYKNRNKLNLRF